MNIPAWEIHCCAVFVSMRLLSIILISWFVSLSAARAQVTETDASSPVRVDSAYMSEVDSIMRVYEEMKKQRAVEQVVRNYEDARLKKEMSFNTDGTLAVARGLLLLWTDHSYMNHSSRFKAYGDHCNWGDYAVAGAPLVTTWVMKAAGVKSRSKTERMLTANAMALGLSFGLTELTKASVREWRPDHSDSRSFPSGHVSFAFVSASILHREYGYISPWITVGGYTAATGTELLRLRHNKHWMADVYMGAGIGALSTGLGYFLTDKIFGANGINKPEVRRRDVYRLLKFNAQPSGFTFIAGTEFGSRSIDLGDVTMKSGASLSAGAEVSWFLTPNWGVELMTRAVDAQMKMYGKDVTGQGGHLDIYHFDAAAKFSAPMSLGKRLGLRAFAGTRILNGVSLAYGEKTYTIPNETKFEFGGGITYDCLDSDNYAWGFTCDYFHTCSHYMENRYSICSSWKILF